VKEEGFELPEKISKTNLEKLNKVIKESHKKVIIINGQTIAMIFEEK
jgi:hypothetical protein